jgi:hypothetical protein
LNKLEINNRDVKVDDSDNRCLNGIGKESIQSCCWDEDTAADIHSWLHTYANTSLLLDSKPSIRKQRDLLQCIGSWTPNVKSSIGSGQLDLDCMECAENLDAINKTSTLDERRCEKSL